MNPEWHTVKPLYDEIARLTELIKILLTALIDLVYNTEPICDLSYGPEMDASFERAREAISKMERNYD